MNIIKQPTKEQVRDWMHQRQVEHKPVPGMESIRRELGWDIIQRPVIAMRRVSVVAHADGWHLRSIEPVRPTNAAR